MRRPRARCRGWSTGAGGRASPSGTPQIDGDALTNDSTGPHVTTTGTSHLDGRRRSLSLENGQKTDTNPGRTRTPRALAKNWVIQIEFRDAHSAKRHSTRGV